MACLLLILFLAFPRIALVLLFLFSNYLERAYHGLILPLLGFFLLPLTTLAYAWMTNSRLPVGGTNLLILIIAVVVDLGGLSGGAYHQRSWWELTPINFAVPAAETHLRNSGRGKDRHTSPTGSLLQRRLGTWPIFQVVIVLVGLAVNAIWHIAWVDPVAALRLSGLDFTHGLR